MSADRTTASMAQSAQHRYILKRSRRKTLCLIIRPDGTLEVRCPLRLTQSRIDSFILEKTDWIQKKKTARQQQVTIPMPAASDYQQISVQTQALTERLIARYPQFRPNRVAIARQRKRWGSCNGKGHIRINACLSLLPEPLAEYVVVHELCHLVHLNHAAGFYDLLRQTLPDAVARKKDLARYHLV